MRFSICLPVISFCCTLQPFIFLSISLSFFPSISLSVSFLCLSLWLLSASYNLFLQTFSVSPFTLYINHSLWLPPYSLSLFEFLPLSPHFLILYLTHCLPFYLFLPSIIYFHIFLTVSCLSVSTLTSPLRLFALFLPVSCCLTLFIAPFFINLPPTFANYNVWLKYFWEILLQKNKIIYDLDHERLSLTRDPIFILILLYI